MNESLQFPHLHCWNVIGWFVTLGATHDWLWFVSVYLLEGKHRTFNMLWFVHQKCIWSSSLLILVLLPSTWSLSVVAPQQAHYEWFRPICLVMAFGPCWIKSCTPFCCSPVSPLGGQGSRLEKATWLILPVVIRSSQRLSHARLSINHLLWNCEWLIISVIVYLIVPYYLDNRSNSRANTCVNTQHRWYLLDWNQPLRGDVVNHNKLADRRWRWIIQVSALSALDGRVLAYHCFNG